MHNRIHEPVHNEKACKVITTIVVFSDKFLFRAWACDSVDSQLAFAWCLLAASQTGKALRKLAFIMQTSFMIYHVIH